MAKAKLSCEGEGSVRQQLARARKGWEEKGRTSERTPMTAGMAHCLRETTKTLQASAT